MLGHPMFSLNSEHLNSTNQETSIVPSWHWMPAGVQGRSYQHPLVQTPVLNLDFPP